MMSYLCSFCSASFCIDISRVRPQLSGQKFPFLGIITHLWSASRCPLTTASPLPRFGTVAVGALVTPIGCLWIIQARHEATIDDFFFSF